MCSFLVLEHVTALSQVNTREVKRFQFSYIKINRLILYCCFSELAQQRISELYPSSVCTLPAPVSGKQLGFGECRHAECLYSYKNLSINLPIIFLMVMPNFCIYTIRLIFSNSHGQNIFLENFFVQICCYYIIL